MDSNEEFVRKYWKGNYLVPEWFAKYSAQCGGEAAAWKEMAKITRNRVQEIQQIEKEIEWIESESSMSDGYPYPEALRILKREEAALEELKRGMRD